MSDKELIKRIWDIVQYWQSLDKSPQETGEGVAFGILSFLDGCSMSFPFNIDLYVGENRITTDENMLHELFYSEELRRDK